MTDTSNTTLYRPRDFIFFIITRFLSPLAMQVQSVAIGWQIYDLRRDPLALGLVGLCQFVPMFVLMLPAGDLADRFDQRRVYAIALALQAFCSVFFLVLTLSHPHTSWPFYAVLVLFGAARGFAAPSGQSLLAFLVPAERLPRSIAFSQSAFTTAVIVGPAAGGFAYETLGSPVSYALCIVAFLVSGALVAVLGGRRAVRDDRAQSRFERVAEGVRFVRSRPIVLGAISLDLFAVLLGGATALLPVFARDILHTGPGGLGLLRSATAFGAATMAFSLAHQPLERDAGTKMFAAVALFGAATIVFGLSHNFWVSISALFVLGASDMISVFVRSALINLATPDDMRGRVSAVNMLFVGASNELGEFESGVTAAWFGTVPAVVLGGIGTLAIVAIWMWRFPPLRNVDRLTDVAPA